MKSIPTIVLAGIALVFALCAIGLALYKWAPWILDYTGVLCAIAFLFFWGYGGVSAIKEFFRKK